MLWLVNSIFIVGIFAFIALWHHYFFVPIAPYDLAKSMWFKYMLFFSISIILLALALRLEINAKVKLSKWLVAAVIVIYSSELYLQLNKMKLSLSHFDAVESLRQKGFDAQRDIGGYRFLSSGGLEAENGNIFPFGGISNTKTVMPNNPFGFHPIIKTDEHGFNNKNGLYDKNSVDIIVVGECTLEYNGQENPYEENIGEQLRKLNYKTINLSKQGAYYLMYLAMLKEYAEPLRPKVVIFSYGGDLNSYGMPSSPFLMKYFNDDKFTQNLISRQPEIDSLLKKFLYENWEKEELRKNEAGRYKISNLLGPETIYLLRKKLDITLKPSKPWSLPRIIGSPNPDFLKLVKKINTLVSSWGGKLYGIYWPPIQRYGRMGNHSGSRPLPYPKPLIPEEDYGNLEELLGIRIINMREEVFDAHADPLALFPNRKGVHLNGKANRLMAEAIVKRLKADGIFPRKN
jgi:hypothetical protein